MATVKRAKRPRSSPSRAPNAVDHRAKNRSSRDPPFFLRPANPNGYQPPNESVAGIRSLGFEVSGPSYFDPVAVNIAGSVLGQLFSEKRFPPKSAT